MWAYNERWTKTEDRPVAIKSARIQNIIFAQALLNKKPFVASLYSHIVLIK